MCLPSRNGAFDAITSAAALSLIPLPLRAAGAMEDRSTFATTRLPTTNQAGYSLSANKFAAVGAVQQRPAEAVQKGGPAKAQRKWVWWGEEEQRND